MPVAIVYRGPAAAANCPEAVAACLSGRYDVVFAGPDDMDVKEALALPDVAVYVQPGGGDDMDVGWASVEPFAESLQEWVRGGGHYVGICMGGFLAGHGPGFGLIENGDSRNYVEMPGADVRNMKDFLISVTWRDEPKRVYFQGGPAFVLEGAGEVLATYSNGAVAAAVVPFGRGSVGVTGPHPEAPQDWYDDCGFEASEVTELFVDLVETTVNYSA